ncbi:MAG: hypothetical protein OQK98_10555 [Gammaproteobacteria bacterium]|nr:hypothetical protein [Gammaproteobacteria bacterium]
MKTLLRIITVFFLFGALVSCSSTNDFTTMCGYFDDLEKELQTKELSPDQKFTFINDKVINNLAEGSAARESWNAIVGYVKVEGRYALFKSAAEATIKSDWHCDSMRVLLKDI